MINHPTVTWISYLAVICRTHTGINSPRCSNTFTVSYFISYFHTAPCTHTHRIQRLFHNTVTAWVIVKQSSSIIYHILYIPSNKKGWSPPQKICYLLQTNSIFHLARLRKKKKTNQKTECLRLCWALELACSEGKHSERHSGTVRGRADWAVREQDRQKCERKLIGFEGKTSTAAMFEGFRPTGGPGRVKVEKKRKSRKNSIIYIMIIIV